MIDIERWYRRCLRQLDWDLNADQVEDIKDGINLFVEDPDWLQYVVQESGWFEHVAMTSAFRKMDNADIIWKINTHLSAAEKLFLAFVEYIGGEEVVFDYGVRLSPQVCDFLVFLGWNKRLGSKRIAYGLEAFESTWRSIEQGGVVGVDKMADLLIDAVANGVSEGSKEANLDFDDDDVNGKVESPAEGECGSQNVEQVQSMITPHLLRKSKNSAYLALKAYICIQIRASKNIGNLELYNKVADAIEISCKTGLFDGELRVHVQNESIDKPRPKLIERYTKRGSLEWVNVTPSAFEGQVRDCKSALRNGNFYQ